MYGGLPSFGGFQPFTEYEVGLGRIAEALHCIMGALGRAIDVKALESEVEHISEELGKVRWFTDEYSRDIYTRRLWEKSKYREQSTDDIVQAGQRLKTRVNEYAGTIYHCPHPLTFIEIAVACYYCAYDLGSAAQRSAVKYVREGPPLENALHNEQYKKSVQKLIEVIKASLAKVGASLIPYTGYVAGEETATSSTSSW